MSGSTNVANQNGLAVASLITGILCVCFCWFAVIGIPAGVVSVSFAFLSRGDKKMCRMSKISAIMSAAGLAVSVFLGAAILGILLSYLNMYNQRELMNGLGSILRQFGMGGL